MNNSKRTEKNTIKTLIIDNSNLTYSYMLNIKIILDYSNKMSTKRCTTYNTKTYGWIPPGSWRFGRWLSISFTCEFQVCSPCSMLMNFSQHQNLLGQRKQIGPPLISQVIFFCQITPTKRNPFFGGAQN